MDCRTARLLFEFARPLAEELKAGEAEALEQHLVECADCARLAQTERAWDDHVAEAMCAVPVPPRLGKRLHARLQAERRRQRLRWLSQRAAVAAALLLALALGWRWQRLHPPRLDLEQVSYLFFEETANPDAEKVEAFFQQTSAAFLAPRDFDYRHLRHYYWAELQGRKVPLLLFTDGNVQARVYFLAATQFNLDALPGDAEGLGSGCKVQIRPATERAVHLVLYTGETLEPFLVRAGPPAAAAGALGAAQ